MLNSLTEEEGASSVLAASSPPCSAGCSTDGVRSRVSRSLEDPRKSRNPPTTTTKAIIITIIFLLTLLDFPMI